MGKYQKNIEAARRISVMQYLETYHPGELVRKTDKEYRTKTHSSLVITPANGKLFGAEPLSVIILKRSFGKIPAGKKLLWVCGDRCFHNVSGIFGRNLNILGKLQVIPIEAVLDMNDSRLDGIHFENSTPSENPYMKRYSVVDYVHRMKQAQSKYHSER